MFRDKSRDYEMRASLNTRNYGEMARWWPFARLGWLLVALSTSGLYLALIPSYFAALHEVQPANQHTFTGRLNAWDMQVLREWGLSLDAYAVCMVAADILFHLSYALVAVLLFWRKPRDRMALLASFALILFPFGYARTTLQGLPSDWMWIPAALVLLGNVSMIACAYVFPDGRLLAPWMRWLVVLLFVFWLAETFVPAQFLSPGVPGFILLLAFIASALWMQVYRYIFVATPHQRQQMKWVVFGTALAVMGNIGGRVLSQLILLPLWPDCMLIVAGEVLIVTCSMLIIPPAIGIAIFSARLWDIDVIIHRTLVYSVLTAALAVAYVGVVVVLQIALGRLIAGNDLIIVASTLVIVALFQPLRRRIQKIIDHRFYRRKYDAARTLASFSATLGNEVNLEQLSEQLVSVVEETMQPEHASLWLRYPVQRKRRSTMHLPIISSQDNK